jgi:single-strand DNA-binding protein
VTIFGKRAEALAQYLLKGTRVAVVGRFHHRSYTCQDDTAGCAPDVIATEIDFAGGTRLESEGATHTASAMRPRPVENVLVDDDVLF